LLLTSHLFPVTLPCFAVDPPVPLLAAEAIEAARRLERLAEMSGGGNRVTLSSLASIDEDGEQQAQQRLSLILKVGCQRSLHGAAAGAAVGARTMPWGRGDVTARA
jgi:hypothetical protein